VIDGFYAIIAGIGNAIGNLGASFQTRKIQNYFLVTLIATAVLVAVLFLI
jgi:hypothetical protein